MKVTLKLEKIYLIVIIFIFIIALILSICINRKQISVTLYMKERNSSRLAVEKRIIPSARTITNRVNNILSELISGPIGKGYERLFLPNTWVQSVYVTKNGIVYISFDWTIIPALRENPSLVIHSIVASLRRNIREIQGVRILIEYTEPVSTFGRMSLNKVLWY